MRRAFVLAIGVAACGDNLASPSLPTADELYDPTRVWDLAIGLSDDALDALRRAPRTYVRGGVAFEGQVWEDVGIRLKGTFSFRPIDDKPALRVKFSEFVEGGEFLGLPSLTLNNLTQDRTLVHEALGYGLFRELGVPASRAGFVRLWLNGQDYGLYANIEPVNGQFLGERFADASGPLYEAGIGDDLVPGAPAAFEHEEGPDDRAALDELAAWATDPARDVFGDPASPLDREAFLAFAIGELVTAHWDGYHKPNNYYLYREPLAATWQFLPSGLDQIFERPLAAYRGDGQLLTRCAAESACRGAYAAHAAAVAVAFDPEAVVATQGALEAAIDAAAAADDRKPYPMAKYARHRAELRDRLAAVPALLAAAGACVDGDGVEVDADDDGYGACRADCNDADATARPGGTEACDGLDNDCDGAVDETAACPCTSTPVAGRTYHLCAGRTRWSTARALCAQRGQHLADVATSEANAALFAATQAVAAGRWYLGYNDLDEEGVFVWDGETPRSFEAWPAGEPDDYGEEDCVTLDPWADGGWTDQRCGEPHPYVCVEPAP